MLKNLINGVGFYLTANRKFLFSKYSFATKIFVKKLK